MLTRVTSAFNNACQSIVSGTIFGFFGSVLGVAFGFGKGLAGAEVLADAGLAGLDNPYEPAAQYGIGESVVIGSTAFLIGCFMMDDHARLIDLRVADSCITRTIIYAALYATLTCMESIVGEYILPGQQENDINTLAGFVGTILVELPVLILLIAMAKYMQYRHDEAQRNNFSNVDIQLRQVLVAILPQITDQQTRTMLANAIRQIEQQEARAVDRIIERASEYPPRLTPQEQMEMDVLGYSFSRSG